MSELHLTTNQYLEFEKLTLGVFQPVTGFMNEDEFRSVVDDMRLTGGEVFPLPITLSISKAESDAIKGQPRVALIFEGSQVGTLEPQGIFTCDKVEVSEKIFGTRDVRHPGVANFLNQQPLFVGGPVSLSARAETDVSHWELTPQQTRAEFARRGWETVVGFQTRNVPHRAHEYLQRIALEHVDGLFIQPLVGWKRPSDYTPNAIMTGYRALIEEFFPTQNVLLSILSTAMRYAGPREAIFHAIIRRNYGCTHFIIGRDHAGIGDFYGKYEAQELTRRFDGELGIEIMRLNGPYHCRRCGGIVTEQTCPHLISAPHETRQISGTDIRKQLTEGATLDPELIRPEVVASLHGLNLFVE
jgi:sulfate adenylyltransferase